MEKKKKKWEKPVCERVKLVPAEAVKSGCKKASTSICLPGGRQAVIATS